MAEAVVEKLLKIADECWIALAKLLQEQPARSSFSAREILDRVRREAAHHELRPGVQPHIHLHNVANLAPNTARYRMFYRLDDGTYRLYRPGDPQHPERSGKTHPAREDLPVQYHGLLDWYESQYCSGQTVKSIFADPIRRLRGLGKEIWAGVNTDEYVNELRSGWQALPAPSPGQTPAANSNDVWKRVVRHQGAEFRTIRGRPFTYEVEGSSGIWFFLDGRKVNRRLWRGELEDALKLCPLTAPSELKSFQDPSYLFGLLTDPRIIGRGN